jgi:hypothetical protein
MTSNRWPLLESHKMTLNLTRKNLDLCKTSECRTGLKRLPKKFVTSFPLLQIAKLAVPRRNLSNCLDARIYNLTENAAEG